MHSCHSGAYNFRAEKNGDSGSVVAVVVCLTKWRFKIHQLIFVMSAIRPSPIMCAEISCLNCMSVESNRQSVYRWKKSLHTYLVSPIYTYNQILLWSFMYAVLLIMSSGSISSYGYVYAPLSRLNAMRELCALKYTPTECSVAICIWESNLTLEFILLWLTDGYVCSQVSLTDPDSCQKDFTQLSYDYEIRHHRPLRLKKKIYEFYTAPITKFWADSVCVPPFRLTTIY